MPTPKHKHTLMNTRTQGGEGGRRETAPGVLREEEGGGVLVAGGREGPHMYFRPVNRSGGLYRSAAEHLPHGWREEEGEGRASGRERQGGASGKTR